MKERIAIIGDGSWGTALALVLHRNGHPVRVWGPFEEPLRQVVAARENARFLPGVPIPPDIEWTHDRAAAVDGVRNVVLASPSKFFPSVVEAFAPLLPADAHVLSVTKGLDPVTHRRMSETAARLLRRDGIAALSGPSFALEVAKGLPTAVVVACEKAAEAEAWQSRFNQPVFRVYTSDDLVGVELGGTLKNVVAVAAGISDGLGFGFNTKAALVTRGLAEITRLGVALGAHRDTFSGLSGMGDLMLTCTGTLSRNRGVGERLGRGEKLDDILRGMTQVAEGVENTASARALAREADVPVPITDAVHAVLHDGVRPLDAVRGLLQRDPRPERDSHSRKGP